MVYGARRFNIGQVVKNSLGTGGKLWISWDRSDDVDSYTVESTVIGTLFAADDETAIAVGRKPVKKKLAGFRVEGPTHISNVYKAIYDVCPRTAKLNEWPTPESRSGSNVRITLEFLD